MFIISDVTSEDILAAPEDADPVRELAATVGEVEDTQDDGQESQMFQNLWPHLDIYYFVLKSRDMTNISLVLPVDDVSMH